MEKLKSCPFCGSEAKSGECVDDYNNHGVYCANDDCSCILAQGSFETVEEAEIAWNERHRSWNLLMEWLDEIYPADIFDGSSGDIGPQILVKLREINELRKKDI